MRDGARVLLKRLGNYVNLSQFDPHAALLRWAEQASRYLLSLGAAAVTNLLSFVLDTVVVFFSLFFFFREGKSIRQGLSAMLPLYPDQTEKLFAGISETMIANLYGGLAVGAAQGILTGLSFWVLGLAAPILWALVTGLASLVPVVGSALVWGPASILLILSGHWVKALILLIWGAAVVGQVDVVVRPYVVSTRVKVHTLLVFFALLGGVEAFGIIGIFVGPVILSVTLAVLAMLRSTRFLMAIKLLKARKSLPSMTSEVNNIAIRGLTQQQAAARLGAEGPNELPSAKPRSFLAIAWEVLREPMILLLVAAGVIYLILGEPRDSLVLLISIFAILGIDLYQQNKTERALEALRDLSSPRALVIRDGLQTRIAGREVVRGDIVILAEGDRVPADGVVLSCVSLSVDESLLTGESVPVRKSSGDAGLSMARPGGDDLPFVYSGTLVVQGHGVAEIKETGSRTELGRVGKALQTIEPEVSHLKRETKRIVAIMGALGLSICALVALIYGLSSGSWLSGILVGITVAMSLLPEEFAVVLTVFLALGAWRISQRNVLTRRASAIETLGSATVLCVDKTGTLTQNQMSVKKLFAAGQFQELDASGGNHLRDGIAELLEFGVLASQREGFDPMDFALQQAGKHHLDPTTQMHETWKLVREYPLSPKLLAVTRVWHSPDQDGRVVAVKGAPGAVAELCRSSTSQFEEIKNQAEAMAADRIANTCRGQGRFRERSLAGRSPRI